MSGPEDEAALIDRARAGSADAYCSLVRLHQPAVRSYVGRYLRGRDVIDDVAQEVFWAGYQSLGGFQGASLRFWLLGIARRRVALFLRQELQRRSHEMGELESGLLERHLGMVERDEPRLPYHEREMEALRECLKRLPPDDAEIVGSYYGRAQTSAAIARRIGKSDAAVRMALMRLRQALRGCVERRLRPGSVGSA